MVQARAYELRNYATKRPLSRHSSLEGAMLGAMFFMHRGQRLIWTDGHGAVDGHVKFEIACVEYKEDPRQTFR